MYITLHQTLTVFSILQRKPRRHSPRRWIRFRGFFVWRGGVLIFSKGAIGEKGGRARKYPGLILSLTLHGMLIGIPISAVMVEQAEELEIFIIQEERLLMTPSTLVTQKRCPIEPKTIQTPAVPAPPLEERIERFSEKNESRKEEAKIIDPQPLPAQVKVKPEAEHTVSPPIEPPILPDPPASSFPLLEMKKIEETLPSPPAPLPLKAEPSGTASPPVEMAHPSPPQTLEVAFGTKEGPRFLKRVLPVYPIMARRVGIEGRVLLRLTIDEKGNLTNLEVLEAGGYGFTEAAVEAVRQSSFLPAFKDGKPVASRALLPIRFQMRRD